jgi:outer membrane biosynthesis protein TonB
MPEIQSNGAIVAESGRAGHATVLEVPVTIQGSKPVDGQEKRELFSETTKTTIVFGNGAVVNLKSRLLAGQCVFLRNELSEREILCKVLESRQAGHAYYTDLEFTAHDPHFWEVPAEQTESAAPPQKSAVQEKIDAAVASLASQSVTESSAPASADVSAAIPEAPVAEPAISASSSETTSPQPEHVPEHVPEQVPDLANEQEPNDIEDGAHLAALIAMDDKPKSTRHPASSRSKELQPEKDFEDVAQQRLVRQPAASHARPISELELRIRTLSAFGALKNPIVIGIAATILIAATFGIAWRVKRHSSIRKSSHASAVSAQPKQQAPVPIAQSPQALTATPAPTAVTGAATPALPSLETQQQTALQGPDAKDVQNSAAKATDLAAIRDSKIANKSDAPAVLSVKARIPGSDLAVLAKPKRRMPNDPSSRVTTPAKIVSQTQPGIPQWAKGLDADAVVQLDAVIDEKGDVTEIRALSGPRALQREAERVVGLWMFEPARSGGKPTATHMVLTVQFQM